MAIQNRAAILKTVWPGVSSPKNNRRVRYRLAFFGAASARRAREGEGGKRDACQVLDA
jgi:hypothetical protein